MRRINWHTELSNPVLTLSSYTSFLLSISTRNCPQNFMKIHWCVKCVVRWKNTVFQMPTAKTLIHGSHSMTFQIFNTFCLTVLCGFFFIFKPRYDNIFYLYHVWECDLSMTKACEGESGVMILFNSLVVFRYSILVFFS